VHEEGVRAAVGEHDARPHTGDVADLRPRVSVERDLRSVRKPDARASLRREDLPRHAHRPVDHLEGERPRTAHREPGRRRRHDEQRSEPQRRNGLPAQAPPRTRARLKPPQTALVGRPVVPRRLVAQRPARQLDQTLERLILGPRHRRLQIVPGAPHLTPLPRFGSRTSATDRPAPDPS
jgi:hypothetical protein